MSMASSATETDTDTPTPYPALGSATSLSQEYINWRDIQAFAEALKNDPSDAIISIPDWAPIHQRVKRGSTLRANRDVVRSSISYDLSRWPLLGLLFMLITFEFFAYIFVRQCVNIMEHGWYWLGKRSRLRAALRQAVDYDAWKLAATKMDDYLGFNYWKRSAPYSYYDSSLVRRVRDNLRELRTSDDADGVRTVLEICLRANFAGIESSRLYSETYLGTKDLVEDYYNELQLSLQYLRNSQQLSPDEKSVFLRSISRNFGTSALCLSGGATFGYYHFGVMKALLDAEQLPRVISGTSAGALIAAFVCCRTSEELKALLTPKLAVRLNALEADFKEWGKRFWKTGARFDAVDWAAKACFFTLGSMTFKEAYERTGRILNISVIPYETHSPTKLLNYLTAPDCVIYTAAIASAAVPGLLQPVVLMNKKKDGTLVPWQFQGRHKDGSLRVDIPLERLHLLFNCNFSIVSQVNPHISLFFFQPRGAPGRPVSHRGGKGWRGGYLLSAAEQFLKIELTKNFRVIRDLELMPEFGGQNWNSVFLQKFEGSVTVFPQTRLRDWLRLLTDPDERELARMIDAGQRVTWPKLHMISNRLKIEREVEKGRAAAAEDMRSNSHSNEASAYIPAVEPVEVLSPFESDSDLEFARKRRRPRPRKALSQSRRMRLMSVDSGEYDNDEDIEERDARESQDIPPERLRSTFAEEVGIADETPTSASSHSRKKDLIKKLGINKGHTQSASEGRMTSMHRNRSFNKLDDQMTARRRLSMGNLRLAERIRGEDSPQVVYTTDEEEDEDDYSSPSS